NYPRPPYKDDRTFPAVKCPVLLVHGLDDKYLLPGALNDTWKWVEKDLTLVTVPKAGHWVHRDAADLVNRRMVRWLTQDGGGGILGGRPPSGLASGAPQPPAPGGPSAKTQGEAPLQGTPSPPERGEFLHPFQG